MLSPNVPPHQHALLLMAEANGFKFVYYQPVDAMVLQGHPADQMRTRQYILDRALDGLAEPLARVIKPTRTRDRSIFNSASVRDLITDTFWYFEARCNGRPIAYSLTQRLGEPISRVEEHARRQIARAMVRSIEPHAQWIEPGRPLPNWFVAVERNGSARDEAVGEANSLPDNFWADIRLGSAHPDAPLPTPPGADSNRTKAEPYWV